MHCFGDRVNDQVFSYFFTLYLESKICYSLSVIKSLDLKVFR